MTVEYSIKSEDGCPGAGVVRGAQFATHVTANKEIACKDLINIVRSFTQKRAMKHLQKRKIGSSSEVIYSRALVGTIVIASGYRPMVAATC